MKDTLLIQIEDMLKAEGEQFSLELLECLRAWYASHGVAVEVRMHGVFKEGENGEVSN